MGYYEASNFGRVRGVDRVVWAKSGQIMALKTRVLALRTTNNGYVVVVLSKNGDYRPKLVHRLVLKAFRGEASDDFECCHMNGVRTDNRIENLRWGTKVSNARDQVVVHRTHRNVRKTHCKNGHAFTLENIHWNQGKRRCLTCKRAHENDLYRRYGKRRAPARPTT